MFLLYNYQHMARVLLIEPDRILSEVYTEALQMAGHEVAVVAGAQAALDEADEHLPEIVVLELQLAEHDGIEFLYEFRSYPEWQNIPVILNCQTSPQALTAALPMLQASLGVVEILYKPRTSLQQLTRSVKAAAGQ